MLRYIDHKQMGRGKEDWLDSHFHFSFAGYCNPDNVHFGALRVLNDDTVKAGEGFGIHPHKNMEIISYVIDGELTHSDSMGNSRTLKRGEVQYMSAGSGVAHSEMNMSGTPLRFLQIWIMPDQAGYKPNYGDYPFNFEDRRNRWLSIASCSKNAESSAPIRIHQDINLYATALDAGKKIDFDLARGRQAYLVLIEGEARVKAEMGEITLVERDAAEVIDEAIEISAHREAHMLLIEMKKR
jgi:redox-sensitive bicupin YhaK (pirin superfamily)